MPRELLSFQPLAKNFVKQHKEPKARLFYDISSELFRAWYLPSFVQTDVLELLNIASSEDCLKKRLRD